MKFLVWNDNAVEDIDANSAQEAQDQFINLHPKERYNVINIKQKAEGDLVDPFQKQAIDMVEKSVTNMMHIVENFYGNMSLRIASKDEIIVGVDEMITGLEGIVRFMKVARHKMAEAIEKEEAEAAAKEEV